jgi:putative glutamine amidotransferase
LQRRAPHVKVSAMSDDPVIGICAVRERARWAFWDQTAHLVADTYVAAVQSTGALAVLLPVEPRVVREGPGSVRTGAGAVVREGPGSARTGAGAIPERLLDRIDGLLLIGGADLDPRSYREQPDPGVEASYRERDDFEIALTRAAIERGMPYLGICRGMQVLNVALGGNLNQHLALEDGTTPHRRVVGTFEGNEHLIYLEPGSLAARALEEEQHEGRCHHHQAIDRLGSGLVVTGRADDGVPEAIELLDGGWVLGVQWHPEAAEKRELFRSFVAAAREWAAEPAVG